MKNSTTDVIVEYIGRLKEAWHGPVCLWRGGGWVLLFSKPGGQPNLMLHQPRITASPKENVVLDIGEVPPTLKWPAAVFLFRRTWDGLKAEPLAVLPQAVQAMRIADDFTEENF